MLDRFRKKTIVNVHWLEMLENNKSEFFELCLREHQEEYLIVSILPNKGVVFQSDKEGLAKILEEGIRLQLFYKDFGNGQRVQFPIINKTRKYDFFLPLSGDVEMLKLCVRGIKLFVEKLLNEEEYNKLYKEINETIKFGAMFGNINFGSVLAKFGIMGNEYKLPQTYRFEKTGKMY